MSLCFWVRLCPSIESTSDDTGALRDQDKQLERHTNFCYYRHYSLSPELCEELDLAGFADSSSGDGEEVPITPGGGGGRGIDATDGSSEKEPVGKVNKPRGAILPPPKKPQKNEIFVAMLVRNTEEMDMDEKTQSALDDLAFTVDNDFEEGISHNTLYETEVETEAMSGVDTPRNNKSNGRLGLTTEGSAPSSSSTSSSERRKRVAVAVAVEAGTVWSSQSSPFAEIYGWGRNTAYLFDKNKEKIADRSASMLTPDVNKKMEDHDTNYVCFNPAAISIPPSIHLERIRMIACSPTHMLVLTYNGSVYSCGDNTEGALGLGDTKNRQSLDLVLWPTAERDSDDDEERDHEDREGEGEGEEKAPDKQRHVVCISAGAAAIGAHSMAITASGALYGWGVAYASGHGSAKKSITSPQEIFMPQPPEILAALRAEAQKKKAAAVQAGTLQPIEVEEEWDEEYMTAAEIMLRDDRELEAAGSAPVRHVACGGGFTVAVLRSGHVASWGMWSHGRLGLGPPPKIEGETKKARGRNKKKVVRYQLRPRLIPALRHVVKVCKESFNGA